jgi:hypothetical protein
MLRLSEAAARLGIAQGTLRSYADRGLIACTLMPNGERRFSEEAVERFQSSAPPTNAPQHDAPTRATPTPPQSPPARHPAWTEVAPWDRVALAAKAELEAEKARREKARLATDDAARAAAAEREAWDATLLRIEQVTRMEAERRRQHEAAQTAQRAALAATAETLAADVAKHRTATARRRGEGDRLEESAPSREDQRLEAMEAEYLNRRNRLDEESLRRGRRR